MSATETTRMTKRETGTVVLEATGLKRHYPVSRSVLRAPAMVKALDGAAFKVKAGQTLAIVGESGCGKSTLARLVALIEEPTEGDLVIDGIDTRHISEHDKRALRCTVQMVFQNPYGSLNPRKKVGDILEEPLIVNTSLSATERRARVEEVMAKVGLRTDHYGRYPHMFSGGQRQRIAIARALMLNPAIVVADEPVSALDISIQAQVLNLMMDLQDELGVAYLFISHDLGVVRHIATDVMVMYLGKPVESGAKEIIFEAPLHPYTRALMASTPQVEAGNRAERTPLTGELPSPLNPPPGCTFHKRCPIAQPRCATDVPELRMLGGRQVACHFAEQNLS
jgi:dipeptide transport system ATP-binding protein